MSELRDRVENQRVRVSMNVKHLCVQSGDKTVVQLQSGQYGELPIEQVTFSREGEFNESPWTRFYDMSVEKDRRHVELLREMLEKNPHLHDDINFRVRIAGEFDSHEPWPGYDDQDAEQIIAYFHAMPPNNRPSLENILAYELSKDETNKSKVVAIESLENSQQADAKKAATAGVKL
jgi:hypothetical protein